MSAFSNVLKELKSISNALFTTVPSVPSIIYLIGNYKALNYSSVLMPSNTFITWLVYVLISTSETNIANAETKQV